MRYFRQICLIAALALATVSGSAQSPRPMSIVDFLSVPRLADPELSGLRFDFAGIKGLGEFSPRSGVTFGVTYDSPSIFAPAK